MCAGNRSLSNYRPPCKSPLDYLRQVALCSYAYPYAPSTACPVLSYGGWGYRAAANGRTELWRKGRRTGVPGRGDERAVRRAHGVPSDGRLLRTAAHQVRVFGASSTRM
eukprot:525798-Rhodomonas_salina.1